MALAVLLLAVYLAIPTKNYYWDGISFAQTIEDASRWTMLLQPNHLIYNVLGWGAYHALGRGVRALYALQALNAAWAALTAYLLSGILAETIQSVGAALLLTVFFSLSGTWWRYATDADAYIASVALLVASAHFLLARKGRWFAGAALFHAAAMLVHQLALLFLPAALFAVWRSEPPAKRLRGIAAYIAMAGLPTVAGYAVAFAAQTGRFALRPFLAWMTSHAADASFSFRWTRNLTVSARNWVQVWFVGRPSLLRDPQPAALVALVLCAAALALLVAALARGFPRRPVIHDPFLFRFSALWISAYGAFLFFWLPHNTFYKLFALPGAVLLIASCWSPGRDPKPRGAAVLFVAVMVLFNLALGIIPYSRPSSNAAVAFAISLREPLGDSSVVYFQEFGVDDWFIRYFNPRTEWKHAESTAAIDTDLRLGRPVWVETSAIAHFAAASPAWFQLRATQAEWHDTRDPAHLIRFARLAPLTDPGIGATIVVRP